MRTALSGNMRIRGEALGRKGVSHVGGFSIKLDRLPADARERVDAATLASWVQAETEPFGQDPRWPAWEAIPMLQLLTFAYACNVLASEQIVVACKINPVFRSLCGGRPPFPPEIASFRRRHREELEKVLAGTFARVMRELTPATQVPLPALLDSARDRLNIARHLDTPS